MPVSQSSPTSWKWRWRADALSSWYPYETYTMQNASEMFSINHFPLDVTADDGGPWWLHRSTSVGDVRPLNVTSFEGSYALGFPVGFVLPNAPTKISDSALNSQGTTAIARTAPTNPAFSLSTSLGELMSDGLPMVTGASLFRERARLARSAGGEYLNVQFGWLPLLSDIRSFAKAVKDSDRILNQYRRDSGMKVRRGYDFPISDTTTLAYGAPFTAPTAAESSGKSKGQSSTFTTRVYERKWFRGAFRYHIPISDTTMGKFQQWVSMSDHLLGWKVTPETLWNIAPWSWAVDWFTNTGDVMTNISNLGKDGLVLQYGYSMNHRFRETRGVGVFLERGNPKPVTLTRTWKDEWKQRMPATPYGFGVNLGGLSPKQIAIIAALGLSKT